MVNSKNTKRFMRWAAMLIIVFSVGFIGGAAVGIAGYRGTIAIAVDYFSLLSEEANTKVKKNPELQWMRLADAYLVGQYEVFVPHKYGEQNALGSATIFRKGGKDPGVTFYDFTTNGIPDRIIVNASDGRAWFADFNAEGVMETIFYEIPVEGGSMFFKDENLDGFYDKRMFVPEESLWDERFDEF